MVFVCDLSVDEDNKASDYESFSCFVFLAYICDDCTVKILSWFPNMGFHSRLIPYLL